MLNLRGTRAIVLGAVAACAAGGLLSISFSHAASASSITVTNPLGFQTGSTAPFAPTDPQGTGGPLPVTSISAAPNAVVTTDLTFSWKYSTTGPAASGAIIELYSVSGTTDKYLTYISCANSCTSATFRYLTPGTSYLVYVFADNATNEASADKSATYSSTSNCAVGACVSLNATTPLTGSPIHAASGLLDSEYPVGNDQADIAHLNTTSFRGDPSVTSAGALTSTSWQDWDVVTADKAVQTTLILSPWWQTAYPNTAPWSNWTQYSSWVESTVKQVIATGQTVTYWEPYNEPSGATYSGTTTADLLEQFLYAYNAIKAVDSSAQVIGPSLAQYGDAESQESGGVIPDMITFLNYANNPAANPAYNPNTNPNNPTTPTAPIQLAAVSWHDIADYQPSGPPENTLAIDNVIDQVQEVRATIAAFKPNNIGSPLIFINEYGMPELQEIPGWDVQYLAALTDAGVNLAGRSCWDEVCANPQLDQLLGTNGTSPYAEYWERIFYGQMSGVMMSSTSSSDSVQALASYNASNGTVTGLVGRGVGCTIDPTCLENWPAASEASATSVDVTVTVPWSSGTVSVALTDFSPGSSTNTTITSQPSPTTSSVKIVPIAGTSDGTVTIAIPSFADGSAYGFSFTN
jgi:hypothetical protein